jgi:hypothetical protein
MRRNERPRLASGNPSEYYARIIGQAAQMRDHRFIRADSRGITVLSLLLLIIALVIAAIFLVRYLRNRPSVSSLRPDMEVVFTSSVV